MEKGESERPQWPLIGCKACHDGKEVALLDADFGLANAHIMLNQK